MKKIYNEYFYIPKHGKIREKVMVVRVALTAFVMIVCLVAMSMTAYAYFSGDFTSVSGTVKAASFGINASVLITDVNANPVEVTVDDDQISTVTLNADTEYSVTLIPVGTAKTGFCVITAEGCGKTYHTQQLGIDATAEDGNTPSVTFTLTVTDNVEVHFKPHWGTSSLYTAYAEKGDNDELYITNGETVTLSIGGGTGNSTEAYVSADEEGTYTVKYGDALSVIAEQYETTVERIVAYNDLANANSIKVGQKLMIPPADWIAPETTAVQTEHVPAETTATVTAAIPAETTTPVITVSQASETAAAPVTTAAPVTATSVETTDVSEQTQSVTDTETTEVTVSAVR